MSVRAPNGEGQQPPSQIGLFVVERTADTSPDGAQPALPPLLAGHPELARLEAQAVRSGGVASGRIEVQDGDTARAFEIRVEPHPEADGRIRIVTIAGAEITALEDARHAAERERRSRVEIESLHRVVSEYSCDWDYWIGADRQLRWMSPSCEQVTGYSVEDFLTQPSLLIDIVHPDDRERVRREFDQHFREPRRLRSEFRILTRGETRCIDHHCQPVLDAEGAVAGRRASNRDVTERKAAEEAAERHLSELEAIYASAPVGLCVLDADLRYLRINDKLAAMNGRTVAEHLGRTFDEVMPELAERFAARLRRAIATGETVAGEEVRGTTPAQPGVERVWLTSWTPIQSAGRTTAVNLVVEEITERRRIEEALGESETRFRTMAELVPDILFMTDPAGRCQYASPRFHEYTGLPPDAALGLDWMQALHPDDHERVERVWLRAVAAGEPTSFRYRLRGREGGYRWFQTRAHPLRDEQGAIVQWFGVVPDIHPLIAAQEALEEADRRKDEFLAILGHELRNPMAPIRNAVEVIRMMGTLDPQLQWATDVLDQQTAQMARLLDDLLDLPRITRGTLKLDQRPVEIGEVVQQAADSVRPLVQERHHRLTLDLPGGELWVRADPARLLQVLVNLLTNAAKYSDPEGKIHLKVGADEAEVSLVVRDAGRGLSPEMAKRMFEPFARGGEEGDRSSAGLGLGLTIARRLVELHGGRIEVHSAGPGLGSRFSVHLPRMDAPPARPRAAESEAEPESRRDLGGVRILVVDDNPVVARALGILLRLLGHDVETAHTGEEALAAVERFRPRVALLDIGMSGMSGLELAERLRKDFPRPEQLLLVAVTGYGEPGARERSRAAGFDEHLVKPVDRRTLMKLLAGVH